MSSLDAPSEKGAVDHVEGPKDPTFSNESLIIDPAAEAELKRKMDVRIVPSACLIYLLCYLDRSNIVSSYARRTIARILRPCCAVRGMQSC
jgi:hypothetical protein